MNTMKRVGRNLKKTSAQLGQIAKEVGEDCNNEVLSNAKDFYTGAFNRAKKSMKAAIQAAEEYSEDDKYPETLKEDLADTGSQLKQVVKEVAKDCDNEILGGARDFYSGAFHSAQNTVSNKVNTARERSEKRKIARAAARRRRASIRKKLSGKAAVVFVCMILVAALLISAAVWYSQHHKRLSEAFRGLADRKSAADILAQKERICYNHYEILEYMMDGQVFDRHGGSNGIL